MPHKERRLGENTKAASEPLSDERASTDHGARLASANAKSISKQVGRLDWKNDVLPVAKAIVLSYDTAVTLRQLFYRLVSLPVGARGRIPNTYSMYTALAHNTAEARYAGTFPDLIDHRRTITVAESWDSPRTAIEELRDNYRRDRTEGQQYQIYLGVEKAGLVELLYDWFGDMGLPIIALGGQCSKPYIDQITRRIRRDGRPAVLLYAGDHDPTGWSILQNFVDRTEWANDELPEWHTSTMPETLGRKRGHAKAWRDIPNFNRYRKYRVALTPEQCDEYGLPRNPAKEKDPNMDNFLRNFADTLTDDEVDDGLGVQVEVDALEPPLLRQLFADAIEQYWDSDVYEGVLAREESDIAAFDAVLNKFGDGAA
jgi:hypothetical protein